MVDAGVSSVDALPNRAGNSFHPTQSFHATQSPTSRRPRADPRAMFLLCALCAGAEGAKGNGLYTNHVYSLLKIIPESLDDGSPIRPLGAPNSGWGGCFNVGLPGAGEGAWGGANEAGGVTESTFHKG